MWPPVSRCLADGRSDLFLFFLFPLMILFDRLFRRLLGGLVVVAALCDGVMAQVEHAGFEARLSHPLAVTPDGSRLLAVHAEAASLSVFDVTGGGLVRAAEIPVGLEPVAVRARTNDEVWVVNEVSDTVSVISLTNGTVIAVLATGDEPGDVVFAGGKAFVSCARDNEIWVYDAVTRALLAQVEVEGVYPHSLTVSEDGTRVFAAFLHSGNKTTVLKRQQAPAPPTPSNAALPAAPNTALIVAADDPRIPYTVVDHDVVELDVTTHAVLRYVGGVGTNLLGLAPRPGVGELWVSNTEALNLVRFEPELNGNFVRNRLSKVALATAEVTPHDLNAGFDYTVLPNPAAQAVAVSQPGALVFAADGSHLWVAAFASDRVAKVDAASGAVVERVELRTGGGDSDVMRGPRGLVLDEVGGRLFVLNKLRETLSVIDLAGAEPTVTAEVELSRYDPLPPAVKAGRGYLYDARLSGNGTVSCGICHLDGDRDGLAWDLGDPGGVMQTVLGANLSIHDTRLRPRSLHPMKGPMTTQTLWGMQAGAPFHWRGDKPGIEDFNSTFPNLMGGEEISEEDMADMVAYLMTLRHHPNPNRNLDRSLPATFGSGNPVNGRNMFNDHVKSHCSICHPVPTGSDNNLDLPQESGLSQPVKTPPLRTVYQRLFYDPRPGAVSLSGFGLLHDGTGFELPIGHPYVLDDLSTVQELRDVSAFVMCFDTGTALTVGHTVLVDEGNREQVEVVNRLALLETRARATPADCDLVVRGRWQGQQRSWLFNKQSQLYRADRVADGELTREALVNGLAAGETLSFMGVLPGQGERLGGDLDGDGVLDGDDPDHRVYHGKPKLTQNLADKAVAPGAMLTLTVGVLGEALAFEWRKNGVVLPAETGPTLLRAAASVADAGKYQVTISNASGEVTSREATVQVFPAPTITVQPVARTVNRGQSATFSVTASGTGVTYQWRRDGLPVQGATSRTLTFRDVQALEAGNYSVQVANGAGAVTSEVVALTVIVPPVVTMSSLPPAIVGQAYAVPLVAANQPTRFQVTGLPSGLRLTDGNRVISGKASRSGVFPLKVIAFNSAGSSGAAVTVNLEVVPFPQEATGVFEGGVEPHAQLNDELGGWVRLVTSRLAGFSGRIRLGGKSHAVRGAWVVAEGEGPRATVEIKRRRMTSLMVALEVDVDARTVSGQVKEGDEVEAPSVELSAAGALVEAGDHAGNHTLALLTPSGHEGELEVPQGDGMGGFTVRANGVVRGTVRLADNTVVPVSAPLLEGGLVQVFRPLYRNAGSLSGFFKIEPGAGHRLQASEMRWVKKAGVRGRSYTNGFGPLELEVRGGLYQIPAVGETLPGLAEAKLAFRHGGAPQPEDRLDVAALTLPARHPARAEITGDNPGAVRLTLQVGRGVRFVAGATGSFAGNFTLKDADLTHPNSLERSRKVTFRGVVVDSGDGPRGYGFFNLPEMPSLGPPRTTTKTSPFRSGRVRLEPLP